jgi:hypothetical protein
VSTPHMSGPDYYREAERLLADAETCYGSEGKYRTRHYLAEAATAHATLALTAATALNAVTWFAGMGMAAQPPAEAWQPILAPETGAAGEQS